MPSRPLMLMWKIEATITITQNLGLRRKEKENGLQKGVS
jgi:hypothetical protein